MSENGKSSLVVVPVENIACMIVLGDGRIKIYKLLAKKKKRLQIRVAKRESTIVFSSRGQVLIFDG